MIDQRCPTVVAPGLLVGPAPPPGTWIANAGINILVLMAQEYQPKSYHFPGVGVIHAGIDDSMLPTRRDIKTALTVANYIGQALRDGRTVLVTCAMGRNRSGFVAAMALRFGFGWSAQQAIGAVRAARGSWALSNPAFVKIIETYRLE